MVLTGNREEHRPNYATYKVLQKVGRNNMVFYLPSTEDLTAPVKRRVPSARGVRLVYKCKHFPKVEELASWDCEFCQSAKLLEQAENAERSRTPDIDLPEPGYEPLLSTCDFNTPDYNVFSWEKDVDSSCLQSCKNEVPLDSQTLFCNLYP